MNSGMSLALLHGGGWYYPVRELQTSLAATPPIAIEGNE